MKKAAAIILVFAMALTLCGCHDIYDSSEKAPVPKYSVCVDFSNVETDEVWDEGSGSLIFTQSICRPAVVSAGSKSAVESINEDIAHQYELFLEGALSLKNAALSLADENAKPNDDFEAEQGEAEDNGSLPTCTYQVGAALSRGDVGVISLSYDVYTFSGGAHGYIARSSVSYDAKNGERLTLESISEDSELLNQLVYGYILNISAGDKYKDENGESIFFNPDLTESITEIIESDNWYFSNDGLVFYANPYELAPYGYGRVEFTVPYAAMDGLLKEKYLPAELEGENGMMLAEKGNSDDADDLEVLGTVTLDEDGQSILISAEETVYSVQLIFRNADMTENLLWYRSYMTTDEAVELVCFVPDVQPVCVLRYILADGTVIERGITQSGEDGSVILTVTEKEAA